MAARAPLLFQPVGYFFQRDLKVGVAPAALFCLLLLRKNTAKEEKKKCFVSSTGEIWLVFNICT